uniref:Non-homologous end-joining factor 1 n=1 Tax=Zeugodacus cucurbitae TaxID=28588 RepID=A0A0A1X481_ZEUCU
MFSLDKHIHRSPRGQRRSSHLAHSLLLCTLLALMFCLHVSADDLRAYKYVSRARERQLENLAKRINESVNPNRYPCESFYDYVCSYSKPLFTILGHLPELDDIMKLSTELQQDPEKFTAKDKMLTFFVSCTAKKLLEDCYRETFEYFKPVFGYIINKNHIGGNSVEHQTFLQLLDTFLYKAAQTHNFIHHPIRHRLLTLKEKFRMPQLYFRPHELSEEYEPLMMYPESYKHNVRNLELHRRRNSTYELGVERIMLDWTLYLYQSRNMPMSYYYPTLNVHLWMTLYNTTERDREPKRVHELAECLKLPPYVHVLDEARVLALVYLKAFQNAWVDYSTWIKPDRASINNEIYEHENRILSRYKLDNKKVFFILYARNFCEFGKELSENIFYLGMKQNRDFADSFDCVFAPEPRLPCNV